MGRSPDLNANGVELVSVIFPVSNAHSALLFALANKDNIAVIFRFTEVIQKLNEHFGQL